MTREEVKKWLDEKKVYRFYSLDFENSVKI